MAKKSVVARNQKRAEYIKKVKGIRADLKKTIYDKSLPFADRFGAQVKLSNMKRDGSAVRYRNRCNITSRPRGYDRRVGVSRIMIRHLALVGLIPGMTKSSW